MRETDNRSTKKKYPSLAETIAADGPMEEREAMRTAKALCRLLDKRKKTEADLTAVHPNAILCSPRGKLSFSEAAVPEAAREAYLPPEYVKGAASGESAAIYGLGMLLLFLVTGQTKKSGMDTGVRNQTLKAVINRCTALDSRRRYLSLLEVRAALNRELFFPRRLMRWLTVVVLLCLTVAASIYMFMSERTRGEAEGKALGFRDGYRSGYEAAVTVAPGIGIEDITCPEAYGNLPGNLNAKNGAFAVTGGESLYFACDGRVYRMDPYSRETALLAEHVSVSSLNYWQGYLFYLTEKAVVRLDLGSGKEETVSDRLRGRFCLYEGTLYLDDEASTGYLYGIDAISLETRQLNAETALAYLNAADGKLYFADPEKDDQLFRCDYDGGDMTRLLSKACRDVDLCGGRIYCLTADEKADAAPETLVSMNSTGGELEVLTNQPISRFIAAENGIFYLSASSGYLEWMTPDARTRYTVSTAAVTEFNLAGRWIFYRVAGDDALYRMRIDGSDVERLP